MIKTFVQLLALVALQSCFSEFLAQELPYTSTPTRIYSFTTAPDTTLFINGTQFEWINSRGQHTGLAYLDGVNDSVNLWSYPDDNGQFFPSNIGQRSFSVSVWAQFLDLQSYSRLFETSAIYGSGDNIAIMTIGTTGNLGVRVYSGSTNYGMDLSRGVTPNVWQHVVLVGDQISLNDSTSNTAANYTVYINAVPFGSYIGPLPRDVFRGIANIGKSSFLTSTDNLYFRGWIDALQWYNYQLQDQQVAVHYVCKRPPAVLDIAFAENPSQISGISNPSYSFILTDPDDVTAGIANYRKGLLTFDGTSQFIDLTTNSGSNSIGTTIGAIGGNGYGTLFNQNYNGYNRGWTFECLVKFTQLGNNAKVYHFSDGGANDIYLGFSNTSSTLVFSIATNSIPVAVQVMQNTPTGQWMHIVITVAPQVVRGVTTVYFNVFINGAFAHTAVGVMPAQVSRTTAYLARSATSSNDAYLGMKLDSMRIFDFALDNSTINKLYITTNSPLPVDNGNATRDDMYSTSPVAIYGFDDPTLSNFSSFTWINASGDVSGIALFSGNWNSFVDLSTFTDDYNRLFPTVIGGDMSFEAHVQYLALNSWSRIFDFGGIYGFNSDNVYLANDGTTADLHFNIYSGSAKTPVHLTGAWVPGKWQHVVCTIEQVDFANPTSSTAAMGKVYMDGVLIGSGLTYLPATLLRPNLYLGRSNTVADARYRGMMDFFAYYQYALTPEQVAAHSCITEPPRFEADFNKDPRQVMGGDQSTYTYSFATTDSANTDTWSHSGLLDFSNSQYVDLTTYRGPSGIGTILPFLGNTSGFASSVGMTIELSVKFRAANSPVFDFGAGTSDRLSLTFTSNAVQFFVSNSITGGSTTLTSSALTTNTWYHIIIVMTPNDAGGAVTGLYIDGSLSASNDQATYPAAVNRSVAYIGRSQDGNYANMLIDSFRIYDYAITPTMVNCLFVVTNDAPAANTGTPVYSSRPINFWGFENPSYDSLLASYVSQQEIDGRSGVAYFDGVTSFANLGTFSDSYGNGASVNLGGELTFQTWLYFSSASSSMRIFDFSNAATNNSFNLIVGDGNSFIFTIYGTDGTPYPISTPTSAFVLNKWVHVCISIAQVSSSDSTSASAASITIYLSGVSSVNARGPLPPISQRNNDYLARGIATSAIRFNGYMDSFAMYNYPVQPESLGVHMVSSRLPIFEVDFARNPIPLCNLTGIAGYGWSQADNPASKHTGILTLDKNYVQYVNLRSIIGSNTVGVLIPELGGQFNQLYDGSSGFSIHISFKVRTTSAATLLFIGNSGDQYQNVISLVLTNGGNTLSFTVTSSYGNRISTLTIIDGVAAGTWYDVVLTLQPTQNQYLRSTWGAFVNGKRVAYVNNMVYPIQGVRTYARLGGNTTSDAYDGYIDAFRIFDDVITLDSIQSIYALTTDLSGTNLVNLGCGQSRQIPTSSLLISFILNVDIASLDSTFGGRIESSFRSALGIRASMVGCQSASGTNGRVSLEATPTGQQTLVRLYLFQQNRQQLPNVSFALLPTLAANGTLTSALTNYGLQYTVDPTSFGLVQPCSDGTAPPCASSGSSGLSGGAIAGIVIGVIVGVALIFILFLYYRRRSGGTKDFTSSENQKGGNWENQEDDDIDTTTAAEGNDIEMQ